MPRRVILTLILAGFFISISHPQVNAASTPNPKKSSSKKLFLWKIHPRTGLQNSYILGSIHLLKPEFFPLHETIEKAFSDSSILAVETLASPEERVATTMKKGIYIAGDPRSLKDQTSEKTYRLLTGKLKTFGMDIGLFAKFKPWYMAQTISVINIMKRGFQPGYGIDVYFIDKAKEKKEIIALEKLDEQVDFYDTLPQEVNEAYLLSVLKQETPDDGIEQIAGAWLKGDAKKMNRILVHGMKNSPALKIIYEKLVYERNRNMADRIAAHLKTAHKSFFFIVGATHLVGKRGIIRLLMDKGFPVDQL